ncbi:hypothetical protein HFO24_12990 [Rhizobium laguerreae]|uniref:nucleotidyltransferase domain-containing protein n=1 Tax=Rhizobium laguerreae TaxID=1076926 RepID=UPI001C910E0B|nr:hypothetical protein [Rhizobium laguerreae]
MWQEQFIEKIRQVVSGDPRVVGLFLAGSFGKGQADTYSDIDLLAVVARDDQAEFSGAWRQQLEKIAPTADRQTWLVRHFASDYPVVRS